MERINKEFSKVAENDVKFAALNLNALTSEGRSETLEKLAESMGPEGKVRLLIHSIAFGNMTPSYNVGADGTILFVDREVNPKTAGKDLVAKLEALGISRK